MYRFKSINVKISFVFIVVITIIVAVSNTVVYLNFSNIILKRILNDQKNIMLQNKTNVENIANGINQATVYLYTDKTISSILNKDDEHYDQMKILNDKRDLEEQFRNYVNAPISSSINVYFAVLFLNDNFKISKEFESNYLGGNMDSLNGVFNNSMVKKQSWFKKTVQLNGALYTFSIEEDKSRVYVARFIRNQNLNKPDTDDALGVVVIGIDVKHFSKNIEASKLTKSTQVFLVNTDEKILYSNNKNTIGLGVSTVYPAYSKSNSNDGEPFIVKNNKTQFLTTVYSLHWGWRLISTIPYSDIVEGLDIIKKIIALTTIIGLVVGIVLTIFLSNSVTKPIIKLARTMQNVRNENNIDICIESNNEDEVGILYKNFNSMMKRINKLIADVYEGTKRQKNAELKTMQAQINPHFIYNTLDSINWIALCNNEDKIALMVSSLAHIMRYSIKNPDEKVEIEEEITHVKKYVSIQFMRYDDKFNVEYNIIPDILKYKIPKFVIQPLVENAIIHGIKKSSRRVLVIISAVDHGEYIEISVQNDGAGANIQELNNYLKGNVTSLTHSDGFGIKNVNERIKLNYGERYGLQYSNNNADEVKATINIPKEI